MNIYRGCIVAFFLVIIALLSLVLSLSLGLFGLLLPPVLIGFIYLLVDTLIVELMWWDRDRNG